MLKSWHQAVVGHLLTVGVPTNRPFGRLLNSETCRIGYVRCSASTVIQGVLFGRPQLDALQPSEHIQRMNSGRERERLLVKNGYTQSTLTTHMLTAGEVREHPWLDYPLALSS